MGTPSLAWLRKRNRLPRVRAPEHHDAGCGLPAPFGCNVFREHDIEASLSQRLDVACLCIAYHVIASTFCKVLFRIEAARSIFLPLHFLADTPGPTIGLLAVCRYMCSVVVGSYTA